MSLGWTFFCISAFLSNRLQCFRPLVLLPFMNIQSSRIFFSMSCVPMSIYFIFPYADFVYSIEGYRLCSEFISPLATINMMRPSVINARWLSNDFCIGSRSGRTCSIEQNVLIPLIVQCQYSISSLLKRKDRFPYSPWSKPPNFLRTSRLACLVLTILVWANILFEYAELKRSN